MPPISRREFIRTASSTAACGALVSATRILHADPLGLPIGCETYPVRAMIAKDFPGTLKNFAAAGFQTIELCSPVGYADAGFGGLAKYKGSELRRMIHDAGPHLRQRSLLHRRVEEESGRPHRLDKRPRRRANDRSQSERPKESHHG